MSALFDRLSELFHASSHLGPIGLRDDSAFAPPELRAAAGEVEDAKTMLALLLCDRLREG